MRNKQIIITVLLVFSVLILNAQSSPFDDDLRERGYFDHPYLRYEAESGKCETNGTFLQATYDQRELQSEASNQMAVQLISENDYVEWLNAKAADGLTLRFSLPDTVDGKGTRGNLVLYINGDSVQTITLNSYWAWQYILKSGSKYPDNIPDSITKFPRMRFDEMHVKLNVKIPENATFRLAKADKNDIPYTIDFAELEEVQPALTFESITDANKVEYSPANGKLQYFVTQNAGKTIFLPEGKYEVDNRIYITGDNTKILGAGMWYTEIYFNASSDDKSTYNQRGIETNNTNIVVEGLFLNTVNNKRYYNNDDRYQVGKGLMGSFGSNSVIRNVWIEHFECGGWIEGANNLSIQHSRFRDNYADGINLAYGCINSSVEHCSFRNNGDDDMASWSRADRMCENNIFRYSSSENNWRASGLGFFGGKQNKAYNIVITDPMEAGFRVTCDFPGMPFSSDGYSEFYNISVYKGGTVSGVAGISGDLWGNQQGALHINSSSQYDLQNIRIYNIDLYDSKNDAVFIGSGTKYIRNLILRDIFIHGTGRYGMFFYNPKGNGNYCNIQYENIGAGTNTSTIPSTFTFIENCNPLSVSKIEQAGIRVFSNEGSLQITGKEDLSVSVYDILGRKYYQSSIASDQTIVPNLNSGIYIVRWNDYGSLKVFVR
ncbi:MAG: T9SS type A sorting domain-containing protein [Bacteroidales bacterium]|nr:T9SS type A sorting domain-containing protein [Bacteroidales bacterium]MCB9012582.1 T9SS type A sorting domain-containing protein [Bacteroidales bacterium]